jgi:hypothetical protein
VVPCVAWWEGDLPCLPVPVPLQIVIGGMVILFGVAFCVSVKLDKGKTAEMEELHRTHILMCVGSAGDRGLVGRG